MSDETIRQRFEHLFFDLIYLLRCENLFSGRVGITKKLTGGSELMMIRIMMLRRAAGQIKITLVVSLLMFIARSRAFLILNVLTLKRCSSNTHSFHSVWNIILIILTIIKT